jgi:hypothetical protein
MKRPEHFQDYLFHYNPYTELWSAFKREDSSDYFNGATDNITKCTSIKDLVRYIQNEGNKVSKRREV